MASVYGTPVASCPHCGVAIGEAHPYAWCIACGEQLPGDVVAKVPQLQARLADQSAASATPVRPPGDRKSYPAVRILAGAYRALAYLILCLGGLGCIIAAFQSDSLLVAFPGLLYTAFVFLVLLAAGELLGMMPDLVDRGTETNKLLREIKELLSKKTAGDAADREQT